MPRVSDEHRERRRQQILEAARRCFVRQGFHQTSMTDIFNEAGLSAGAVYGYFKSKDEIIAAIAESVIGHVTALLEPIVGQEPPPRLYEGIREGLRSAENFAFGPDGFARLAPQVWAESLRNPGLAAVVRERYLGIHALMTQLVSAEQAAGHISPDTDPAEVAKVVVGAVMGYIVQRVLIDNVGPDSYAEGLAALVTSAVPEHGQPT
ncbi:MAG TPA: TetR/AcrR family transcriptional regulator [Jiangellaceae bacterium]